MRIRGSHINKLAIIKQMKTIIYPLLIVTVISMFSCINESEQKNKNVKKKEIVKDVIKEKVAIKDSIIKVPNVLRDSTAVVGILKAVDESDFWGRVWLNIDVDGNPKTFPYYDYSGDFRNVENLKGKKVLVKYRIEETLREYDLHVNNKTIHGENGFDDHGDDLGLEGTLLFNGLSGDTPSSYEIINIKGDTITITGWVYDAHMELNGKKVTVYYEAETYSIAESVISLEKE